MKINSQICGGVLLAHFILLLTLLAFCSVTMGQETPPVSNDQTVANTTPQQQASPTPIPISEIITQAESSSASLKELASDVSVNPTAEIVERELPALTGEINARFEETARVNEGRPSLEKLRSFETEWVTLTKSLPKWKGDLTDRARKLEEDLKQLQTLDEKWRKTLEEIRNAETPPEVPLKVEEILLAVAGTRKLIEEQQARIVALQSQVAEQQKRVDDAVGSIKQTRESLVGRLFVQDSPPIWNADFWTRAQQNISRDATDTFSTQTKSLSEFAGRNTGLIVIHFMVFAAFAGALIFLRRRADPWVEKEPELKTAAIIFYLPLSTALILAIFFSSSIYPQTPQFLQAIFGAIVLVPTVIILRRLVERPVYPLLYSLVVFYFVDQLRMIAEPLPVVSRLLFLAEMLGGFIFFLWLVLGRLSKDEAEEIVHGRIFRTIKIAAFIALPIFAISFLANAFGYLSLARLLGNAVLRSAYVAVIFYAAVRILDGLIIFALRFRPLSLLGMVQQHRLLIQERARKFLRGIAFLLWFVFTLEFLALREPLFGYLKALISGELNLGSLSISLGDVLAFVVTVWAAFLISRFIRFVFEEDIYTRVHLPRGIPYAISTVLHYVLLLLGFFFALAIIGFDLTKFTILAGAFGVGIGFGLQNIVNNFVSGLILLFERPVNVGDTVEVGEDSGDLLRIGLRASVLRTYQGSEVILPNGELISGRVVNWTLSDQQRRIEINVGVAYGTDPRRVIELLTNVAEQNKDVMKTPSPQTLFLGFGDSSLDFQLRAWTDQFDNWIVIKNDLALGMHDALREAEIEIPFPQRDLHLVTVSDSIQTKITRRTQGLE